MPAGRPPKPKALKVLSGTHRKDRDRPEVQADILVSIPDPPEGMGEWGVNEWFIVCRWLQDKAMLASTDVVLLAAYCNEVDCYWRYDAIIKAKGETITYRDSEGNQIRVQLNPYVGLRKSALDSMLRLASQFGFSPVARARMVMPVQKPKSRMEELKNSKPKDQVIEI